MTKRMRAATIILIAALCPTGACTGLGADTLTGGMGIASSGSGAVESGHLAFLVQPNDVAAGRPISPEVKVVALDTLGSVLSRFSGTVRVALGSRASGGSLSGTISAPATAGLAIFDTLVINQPGIGYTLVASAPGLGSVTSSPFTVFGAIGTAVRAR